MNHPTWIEIDLKSFKKNIHAIKKEVNNRLLLLPIKANAYGFGLYPIAKAALEAGVDYLGVAFVQEGIELRKANINAPILVLSAFLEEHIPELIEYDLEFTISSHLKADLVLKYCEKMNKPAKVHIKVDTGLGRTGMRPETALLLIEKLKQYTLIKVIGIYSHLATSDKENDPVCFEQIHLFDRFMKTIDPQKKLISHIANSGAIEYYPQENCLKEMVRPGLLCFGYAHSPKYKELVKPCFSLKSKVSFFKVAFEGAGISYGHTYKAAKQTRIVTIPIGYGDGYRRSLSNRGKVLIRNKQYPIVGTVCMDQLMVDIGNDEAYVGDEVVLIGKQGDKEISLEEIASLTDTIPYEIFCGFTARIPRIYFE